MKWTDEQARNASRCVRWLSDNDFNFFSGVPCSLLGALLAEVSVHRRVRYVPAVREDAAMSMASGAWLAGIRSGVLIQNSGIGYSLNVLSSLNLIYQIPLLLVISYRGHGPDAPEHWVMGRSCRKLLEAIGIPSSVPEAHELEAHLEDAKKYLDSKKLPAAIFIKKGIFGA